MQQSLEAELIYHLWVPSLKSVFYGLIRGSSLKYALAFREHSSTHQASIYSGRRLDEGSDSLNCSETYGCCFVFVEL